jgi:hypothetical protein
MNFEPFTKEQYDQLRANEIALRQAQRDDQDEPDFPPVVKLFTPDGAGTWLIVDIAEDGMCFGLCDHGHGFPELGYLHIEEIQEARGGLGLKIEVDTGFTATKPISKYVEEASAARRIVT